MIDEAVWNEYSLETIYEEYEAAREAVRVIEHYVYDTFGEDAMDDLIANT